MALDSVYKGFTFAGNDSRDFDVYVQDVTVFNAPARDVEMIEIPGRNGSYALDRGRFENIEITYHCVLGSSSEANWSTAISDLRNALLSKKGYQRLTDDFNAGEYRMAVYKSGLDVSNIGVKTGEFDVVFDCRPQRYLTSGETAVTVTSGGTIENPTLFDASPLLLVDGYGIINLGESVVTINDVPLGDVRLGGGSGDYPYTYTREVFETSMLNTGDTIRVAGGRTAFSMRTAAGYTWGINTSEATASGDNCSVNVTAETTNGMDVMLSCSGHDFAYGTAETYTAGTAVVNGWIYQTDSPINYYEPVITVAYNWEYNGSTTITFRPVITITGYGAEDIMTASINTVRYGSITGNSTKGSLGAPLYIDLDIGEAYKYESGSPVSVNNAVSIGAELPTLSPGENEVTFTNTITSLQIIPRWWKV